MLYSKNSKWRVNTNVKPQKVYKNIKKKIFVTTGYTNNS